MKTFKQHLESAGITFVATFLVVFGLAISSPSFTFSRETIVAAVFAAIVVATRAVAIIMVELGKALLKSLKSTSAESNEN